MALQGLRYIFVTFSGMKRISTDCMGLNLPINQIHDAYCLPYSYATKRK